MSITRAEAFQLLQVSPEASAGEIKAAYRKLALKYHPDKNKDNEGAKRLFQRINAAYNLLTGDDDISSLTEEEIVNLFQDLIKTEWFTFLSQNFDFSDDSDYYDSEEDMLSHEQWEQIEKNAQKNAQKLVDEEEQEKKKLEKKRERRKKHKQRRKEKKREEKETSAKSDVNPKEKYEIKDVSSSIQIIKKGTVTNSPKTADSPKKSKKQNLVESDSDTPEIDLGSAFCSKVKQKVEKSETRTRKSSEKTTNGDVITSAPVHENENVSNTKSNSTCLNPKPPPPQQNNSIPEPPSEENFFKSQEHARKGNEFAQSGKLQNAIEEYTKAIALNQIDHRCYGNRSYCYHSLKKFEEALSDANSAISLVPNEPKGYFRKAKALCGLKRFAEAENALSKILELDPQCSEAAHELFEVRLSQLQDFGFDRRACEHALIKSKNDIQGAIEYLLSSQIKDNKSFSTTDYEEPPPPQLPPPIYPNISHVPHSQMSTFFPVISAGSYTASPLRMPAVAPGSRPPMLPMPLRVPVPYPRPQNIPINSIPVSNMMRMSSQMPAPVHQPTPQHAQKSHNQSPMVVRPNTMAVRPGQKPQHNIQPVRAENKHQNGANGKPGRKFDPRDYSLWIGHFDSKKITEKDLYEVFTKYGKVSGVVIIKTHGKPLAYSFIHFMKHEDAKRAFNAAQNHVIQGVSLDVNWNKNPTIECEHWLRGNCPYSNCHYLHVSDHDHKFR